MRRTVTLEVELDVELPDDARWSNDDAQAFEDWLDRDLLTTVDGREVALDNVSVRIEAHSVTRVATPWPYR